MAVTNQQTAIQAAALSNPPNGAAGGSSALMRAAAADYQTWLTDHATNPDSARAALLAAANSCPGATPARVTGRASELLHEIAAFSTPTSVAVTPTAPSIEEEQTQQFVATATFEDTTTADVTTQCTWASATPAKATIDAATGLATGVAAGTSVITATFRTVASAGRTLTVTTPTP